MFFVCNHPNYLIEPPGILQERKTAGLPAAQTVDTRLKTGKEWGAGARSISTSDGRDKFDRI